MKCRILRPMRKIPLSSGIVMPAGTVIDHKDAHILVQMGHADAADDECARAAKRTPKQLAEAKRTAVKVTKGIHPNDYAAFDAGIIAGYDEEGEYIPGPNWVEPEDDEDDEEEESDAE